MGELLPAPAQAAAFALAVLVLNATPGVDLLLTLSRSFAGGLRAGLATALGINAGCVLHALAAAFGLAALLAVVPGAFLVLQWAGAAYLAWLGLGLLRQAWPARQSLALSLPVPTGSGGAGQAPAAAAALAPGQSGTAWAEFRRGLVTNTLNPKVALFFLAFLPPFVPLGSPSRTASFLLLGAWFVLQSTAFLFGVVLLAGWLRRWQTPQSVQRLAAALGGTLFMVLAWRLAAGKAPAA